MARKIDVSHECGDCGGLFVSGFEFPEKYYCEEDSETWDKGDGRNCPTCHKFGRNTDTEVCPDCDGEISAVDKRADPDTETVYGADGLEVVTERGAAMKEKDKKAQERRDAEQGKRRAKYKAALARGIKKYDLKLPGMFRDEYAVACRSVSAGPSTYTFFCSVSVSPSFSLDGAGKPFEVSFSIHSKGFENRGGGHSGGFQYAFAPSETFDTVEQAAKRAREMIKAE